ncbi:porin, partial [Aquisalimonas sp.]|uniref:porin n=1 Tax=Aquisalimonas sp. TaxID=1872621 RepID=UPI0025C0FB51
MKKVTSALALAALVGTPAAAMANVEFGGDYDVRYFNTQAGDRSTGVDQRIRLQSSFESDGGVEVHARLNLMNDRWTGDGSGTSSALDEQPFTTGGRDHRNVALDYGYMSMPTAIGQVNVGRQMANWNPSGLTTTDDRRDRISLVTPLGGGHTAIVASDVRQSVTTTDRSDDGMLYFGAFLGPLVENVNYGLLIAQFETSSS